MVGECGRGLEAALTINWHDRSLAPERLWGACYRDLIQELKTRGAWFSTAAQAISWFRKRRSAVFETDILSRTEFAPGSRRIMAIICLVCDCESISHKSATRSALAVRNTTSTRPSTTVRTTRSPVPLANIILARDEDLGPVIPSAARNLLLAAAVLRGRHMNTRAVDVAGRKNVPSPGDASEPATHDSFIIAPDDRILVTGAAGFIGSRVVESLVDRGFRNVVCFARPSSGLRGSKVSSNTDR